MSDERPPRSRPSSKPAGGRSSSPRRNDGAGPSSGGRSGNSRGPNKSGSGQGGRASRGSDSRDADSRGGNRDSRDGRPADRSSRSGEYRGASGRGGESRDRDGRGSDRREWNDRGSEGGGRGGASRGAGRPGQGGRRTDGGRTDERTGGRSNTGSWRDRSGSDGSNRGVARRDDATGYSGRDTDGRNADGRGNRRAGPPRDSNQSNFSRSNFNRGTSSRGNFNRDDRDGSRSSGEESNRYGANRNAGRGSGPRRDYSGRGDSPARSYGSDRGSNRGSDRGGYGRKDGNRDGSRDGRRSTGGRDGGRRNDFGSDREYTRPEPRNEAERRAAQVRATRGPRVPKDPDAEREKLEAREVEQWVDEGSVSDRLRPPSGAAQMRRDDRKNPELDPEIAAQIHAVAQTGRGARLAERLAAAQGALSRDRYDDAKRMITPLVRELPMVAAVHEVNGLANYRLGNWKASAQSLEIAQQLRPDVALLPVLADAYRALRRFVDVEDVWQKVRNESPSHEVMSEARIVAAGALADQGDLKGAIALMQSGEKQPKRVRDHHLRQWYVLGDLYDRAGDTVTARRWFNEIAAVDRTFADVDERLRTIGR